MQENGSKSPHILNTSANLLGFCFIVLTSVKISKLSQSTYIDEGAALAVISFMASCLLSFLSMQGTPLRTKKMERLADIMFLFGLIVLLLTTIMITFNIIH